MRIAFATSWNASDVHAWSGTVYHMREALAQAGDEVVPIDRLTAPAAVLCRLKRRLHQHVSGRRYDPHRDPLILRSWARQVDRQLARKGFHWVVGPGSLPFAYLRSRVPVAFWTDCVFAGVNNLYPEFSHLCVESLRDGNRAEQAALTKSSLAIFCSDWARDTARDYYHVDDAKLRVVPFGANVAPRLAPAEIDELIQLRARTTPIRLLFIGVDWHRKGGAAALAAAQALRSRGYAVSLDIVGCKPPVALPPFAQVHGFVSKRTPEGRSRLESLLRAATYLILPSRAECYGLVLAEANAYGVPCLTSRVGGIPSIIESGENGILFAPDAPGEAYAGAAEQALRSDVYVRMGRTAYSRYQQRFNWKVAGDRVLSLLREYRHRLEVPRGSVSEDLAA